MGSLTFDQLRNASALRCREAFPTCDDWTPNDWATAATGELGEACNLLKKMRRGEDVDIVDLAYEIADAVIYLDLLADALQIDLGNAVRMKFNIVSDRVGSPRRL